MGRERLWLKQKSLDDQLLNFFRGRALAWFRQRQYCLGMDYMLRALNMKPSCSANLVLAQAGGAVLGEPDLVAKCNEEVHRQYVRHGVSSAAELIQSHSRLADKQKADIMLICEEANQLASSASEGGRTESLSVLERLPLGTPHTKANGAAEATQQMIDDAVTAVQGPLCETTKRVLVLEPTGSTFGRGLYSDKKIPQGTVILSDTMLAGRSMRGDCCAHCLSSLSRHGATLQAPIRCVHCEQEQYCSDSCRDAAWRQYHQCSCSATNPLYAQWEHGMEAALRGEEGTATTPGHTNEVSTDAKAALNCLMAGKLLCMSTVAQVHPLQLAGAAHLRGFVEFEARSTLANIGAIAVTLSEALRQPNLFVEEVLSLLAMVQTNEILTQQGVCLYPILSLLNHSCTPNCLVAGPNLHHQQLVAIKDIRAGEQLFIDYNPRLTGSLNYEQRRELFQQRNFECFCSKCILKK